MARFFMTAEARPKNWPVLPEEVRQMEQLDIPYFGQLTDETTSVWERRRTIDGFFEARVCRLAVNDVRTLTSEPSSFRYGCSGAIEAKDLRAHDDLPADVPTRTAETCRDIWTPDRVRGAQSSEELVEHSLTGRGSIG